MTEKSAGLGPVKRFGTRYGATVKRRLAVIEVEQKKRQLCPYCRQYKARWMRVGVFTCTRCGSTFTGKAYVVEKRKTGETVGEATDQLLSDIIKTRPKEEAGEEAQ